MTKVEAILQALQALAIPALPVFKVVRSRTAKFGDSELPALNIKPAQDDGLNYANSLNRHEFTAELELFIQPVEAPDSAVDPYVDTLHKAIISDTQLLSLVSNTQYKSRQWQFDDGDGSALKLVITYAFTYLNLPNQL